MQRDNKQCPIGDESVGLTSGKAGGCGQEAEDGLRNDHVAVVGSPSYFANRSIPMTPRDLKDHRGISYRQTTGGGLYAWEFQRGEQELEVAMNGPIVINDGEMLEAAVLDGLALAYTFESQVEQYIANGRLIRVLEDWCEPFPGYHLYYPSRRQHTPAFALLVDALRHKA